MDGIYRIFRHRFDDAGTQHSRYLGRIVLLDGHLTHLEDHCASLGKLLPEGPMDESILQRFRSLQHSPYHEVVRESDIEAGAHDHHIPTLDLGEAEPEASYMLTGEGISMPQLIQVWAGCVTVAGERADDERVREMMERVKAGRWTLTPRE
jgi:hypothetical protein